MVKRCVRAARTGISELRHEGFKGANPSVRLLRRPIKLWQDRNEGRAIVQNRFEMFGEAERR
jgi:hypothetical protein